MPRTSKALRAESARLRELGWSYRRIALELRRGHRLNARVAYRLAHGWTQEDVARRWNERWPGAGAVKTGKVISYWEVWPARGGRAPSALTLTRLAELYDCRPGDLLDGLDFGEAEAVAAAAPGRTPPATGVGGALRRYRRENGGLLAGGDAAVGPEAAGAAGACGRRACDGPGPDVDWVRSPAAVMVHQDGPEAGWGGSWAA